MEAKTDTELKEIKNKIRQARKWARKHFDADRAGTNTQLVDENLNLTKPCYFVEFPDVDRMIVAPSVLGQRSFIEIEYRLYFEGNQIAWEPVHFTHLPKLWIE